jgi:ATP-binding cassette, subfamily B, bacterial
MAGAAGPVPRREAAVQVSVDASPWYPVAVEPRHAGAKATVDPDRSLGWIRRAWPIVRSHKLVFSASLVATVAALAVQLAAPLVLMDAIDHALVERTGSLTPFVLVLVGLAAARVVFIFVSRYLLFRSAYGLEYDFRTIIFEHLQRLSFSFYDRVQSGQLISRANSDIRSVQMFLTFVPVIALSCLSGVAAFAIMLTVNVPLALIAMAPLPFVYFAGVAMRRRMFPVSWLAQARLAEIATIVDESVSGVRVVKSFAAERRQLSLLQRGAKKVQWAFVRDADIRSRWAPLIENAPRAGLALVLLFGGWFVIAGHATIGTIVAFNAYILQLQAPFRQLGFLLMLSQRARASAGRIYEILDEQPEIVDHPGAVDLLDCKGTVELDHVTFSYGRAAPVLDGLSLRLEPGETAALVGPTGSGKSTVARLINRFYDAQAGAVRIDGTDVRELTLGSLRANVGMVLDEPFLFSVSIRDNIAFGRPTASFDDVVAAARSAGAHDFVTELPDGYETVVGERGYTLSGGQRQRIAIARTLLANPPVLILDDATSAIDVHVEQQIHDALRVLMKGRTTLIIAHRLSTIGLADRVVVLDRGRIIADGTHAELLTSEPRYAEILAQGAAEEQLLWDRAAIEPGEVEPGRERAPDPPAPEVVSLPDPV